MMKLKIYIFFHQKDGILNLKNNILLKLPKNLTLKKSLDNFLNF